MNLITICENPFDSKDWKTYECEDILEFLTKHFTKWPETAKLYQNHVSNNTDITPYDEASINRLSELKGNFFVIVYPASLPTVIMIVAVALTAVSFIISRFLKSNEQDPLSTNNALSNRENRERIGGRIPDIYGQLWATPDLIAVPYRVFSNNKEVEYSYMCLGRGSYQIHEVRDDIIDLSLINGAGCVIYGPNTSPNYGTPQQSIGATITEGIYNIKPINSVNGQIVKAPNANKIKGNRNIRFLPSGAIETNSSEIDFTNFFSINDYVTVTNSNLYNGTYLLLGVTSTVLSLSNPGVVNANWNSLVNPTTWQSITLMQSVSGGSNWIGPFAINDNTVTELWCNFVASQGLFKLDKNGNQNSISVNVQVKITSLNSSGIPQGNPHYYIVALVGSKEDRLQKGSTLKCVLPFSGACQIEARRITNTERREGWSVSDQIQWRDLYAVSPVDQNHFGNVTTIHSVTWPTAAALSIKQRKLNILVTRLLNSVATKNAADILIDMSLDAHIGRRVSSEVNSSEIQSILGASGEVEDYFGTALCTEFCYSFDDAKLSFEEMVAQLCQSVFCTAYRRGNVLSVTFEKETEDSTLLFNHRNKIPETETRTVSFGTISENDGIDIDYVEPNAENTQNNDSIATLHFPVNNSAIAPRKITAVGVRNKVQAWILGWRLYNKLLYQNIFTQFNTTSEAALSIINDRVLIADNTKPETQDGEVLEQNILELTLSQPVTFVEGRTYTIFLQHYDMTVEAIGITEGSESNKVILASAPSIALVLDPEKYAKTTYIIVDDTTQPTNAFLIQEKIAKDGNQYEIKAVNYDDRYYEHDQDYVDEEVDVIESVGYPVSGYEEQTPGSGGNEETNDITNDIDYVSVIFEYNGNVGIGKIPEFARLDVEGTIHATQSIPIIGVDLDTLPGNGDYIGYNLINGPVGTSYTHVSQYTNYEDKVFQIAYGFEADPRLFTRYSPDLGVTWSDWTPILNGSTDLSGYQLKSEKGANSGYVGIDEYGYVIFPNRGAWLAFDTHNFYFANSTEVENVLTFYRTGQYTYDGYLSYNNDGSPEWTKILTAKDHNSSGDPHTQYLQSADLSAYALTSALANYQPISTTLTGIAESTIAAGYLYTDAEGHWAWGAVDADKLDGNHATAFAPAFTASSLSATSPLALDGSTSVIAPFGVTLSLSVASAESDGYVTAADYIAISNAVAYIGLVYSDPLDVMDTPRYLSSILYPGTGISITPGDPDEDGHRNLVIAFTGTGVNADTLDSYHASSFALGPKTTLTIGTGTPLYFSTAFGNGSVIDSFGLYPLTLVMEAADTDTDGYMSSNFFNAVGYEFGQVWEDIATLWAAVFGS